VEQVLPEQHHRRGRTRAQSLIVDDPNRTLQASVARRGPRDHETVESRQEVIRSPSPGLDHVSVNPALGDELALDAHGTRPLTQARSPVRLTG
jgi:hypothetical protein